ncbi:MAG: RHS repeat-associated core domain-containing protein [Ktedonobacteraceae bacterium]
MDQKISIPTPIFTSVFSYDGIQRPWESSASRQGSSQPFWDQIRSYDNVGNVLGLTTTVPTSSGSTQTEQEAFCYDALNRVVWAGNTGTPSGGDHCMWSAPGSTSLPAYTQHFSYDDLDRLTTGPAGTLSYLDAAHLHAATHLSSIPNRYAAYDSMGNMTCRNIDPTSGHTCGTTPTGAQMTYDTEGRLANWTAPSGTTSSISYLYDNAGNRVLQHQSTTTGGTTTTTDTVTFDSFTETVITGGTTLTTQFYTVGGQRVAMKQGNALYYLLGDILGSVSVVLKDDGTFQASQLFAPYGTTRYTQGTMPTTYNFTGQRLDSQTGLLYYNSRYYDPISGRFTRADTIDTNAEGMDPYAYVAGNPETLIDSTGHDGISIGGGVDWGGLWDAGVSVVTGIVRAGVAGVEGLGGIVVGAVPFVVIAATPPTRLGCGCVISQSATAQGIANDISGQMGGKPRAWNGEEQRELVGKLWKDTAQKRDAKTLTYDKSTSKDLKKNPHKANSAEGILDIWDSSGRLIFNYDVFRFGYRNGVHAEDLIVQWAIEQIGKLAGKLQGAVINLLIYTQTTVCDGCKALIQSNTWVRQLYGATGLPGGNAIVNMDVWQGISDVTHVSSQSTDGNTVTNNPL